MADDVLEWPVRTAEFMHFPVTTSVDPLADPVKVALPAHGDDPVDSDFDVLDAEWVPGQAWTEQEPRVVARAFIPKNHLTRGSKYDPWVQVTDNPEVVELRAGADKHGRGGTIVKAV